MPRSWFSAGSYQKHFQWTDVRPQKLALTLEAGNVTLEAGNALVDDILCIEGIQEGEGRKRRVGWWRRTTQKTSCTTLKAAGAGDASAQLRLAEAYEGAEPRAGQSVVGD